jgi:hypothetical protein
MRTRSFFPLWAVVFVGLAEATGGGRANVAAAAEPATRTVRVATYNASLYGKQADEVRDRLSDGRDEQAAKIATIVQTVRPDVLLINEIDFDPSAGLTNTLAEKYFAVSQGQLQPVVFPYMLALPSNTGVASGLDINGDARIGGPQDAWGYGVYEGQYALAIFSRFAITEDAIRTFQKFRWQDLPDAMRPIDPGTGRPYHTDEIWSKLRLSSKNHVDVPIRIGARALHVLASHPTPPVFDGLADHNGCRNHDEVRFWIDYLRGEAATYLVDDRGVAGGLPADESFVFLGDLNADPQDGDGRRESIVRLLEHERVVDPQPRSLGAAEAARSNASGANGGGDPALHTAIFGRGRSLRLDYALPSRSLKVIGSGVHWPHSGDRESRGIDASDHRMVWVDLELSLSDR